ncbi:outer membrane beta-barrel domain-containing protein [Hydrocarboniphaga effusa]|jgi:outer membrane beta-barrel protein|uniref:outer membrane beta-barrel domain-containing protein n=1 Tax=Hydrocarboniphaga effusa TaxID=243629 RepID=UPI003137B052
MSVLPLASRQYARQLPALAAAALLLCGCSLFGDRTERTQPSARPLPGEQASSQVVDPNLARPEPEVRKVQAQDYEVGGYVGLIAVDRKDGFAVYGARVAYQKTENFFVEAHYEFSSNVGYDELRDLVGLNEAQKYDYDSFGLSLGYKLAPGDIYLSRNYTLPFQIYAIGGGGYSSYEGDNFGSYHLGGGIKFMPRDWLSVRLELTDQMWSDKHLYHNAQFTFGLAALF